MTTNRRAKEDARDRQRKTGERYTTARRRSAHHDRYFEDDCCANCLEPLPDDVEALFCSELCQQTAEIIRYWRRVTRDGQIEQPDVLLAVQTRVAHLLAGGYHKTARKLSQQVRGQVAVRDGGVCRQCGKPGEEIDHIDGDSADLDNLQLLCKTCHHAKTAERMMPATDTQKELVDALYSGRVKPDVPALLCDDEVRWAKEWSALKKARRERFLYELSETGFDPDNFRGASRREMLEPVDAEIADGLDEGGWSEDDDSGYGSYSYFAHAMAKDD